MWVPHPLRPTCPSYIPEFLPPHLLGLLPTYPRIHPHHTVGAPSFAAHVSVLHTRLLAAAKGGFPKLPTLAFIPDTKCGCPILCGPHVRPTCPAACRRKGWVYKTSNPRIYP